MAHQQLLPVTKVLDGLGSHRDMALRLPKLTALCGNIRGVLGCISKPKAGGTRGGFLVLQVFSYRCSLKKNKRFYEVRNWFSILQY